MENWKNIEGFEGYEVSNFGNVRSSKRGNSKLLKPGPSGTNGEYQSVSLSIEGKAHRKLVHRLTLEAFVGDCPEGMEARHIDGNASNNHVSNLEWATHQANMQDKVGHGTLNRNRRYGQFHEWSTLTPGQVSSIRVEYESGSVTQQQLAERYNTSRSNIGMIVNYETWKRV